MVVAIWAESGQRAPAPRPPKPDLSLCENRLDALPATDRFLRQRYGQVGGL